MGDIDHHVADADDGDMFAHIERPIAESWQAIEVVDDVFGVEDTLWRNHLRHRWLFVPWAPIENAIALAPSLAARQRTGLSLPDGDVSESSTHWVVRACPNIVFQAAPQFELAGKIPYSANPPNLMSRLRMMTS